MNECMDGWTDNRGVDGGGGGGSGGDNDRNRSVGRKKIKAIRK
jgi:hypothetical protein